MKQPKYIISENNTTDKLIKVGLAVALFLVGKSALAKKATDNADDQIDTNPAAGQARALNSAMNPSGIEWMRQIDTTNTDAIYAIAPQITSLDDVKKFYKAQTAGRVLHEDLIKELSAEGYDKFLALATKGKSGSPKYSTTRTDIPVNRWVVTKAEANIRKTPKKQSSLLPNNNIVKVAPKANSIGITTGRYAFDESNDVTFIEFWTLGAKDSLKHYFYVALSQVELLTKAQKDEREKIAKLPYFLLAGLSGIEDQPQIQLVSLRNTVVLDEQFRAIMIAPQNVIIGFPLLTLDTGKGKYTKLKTVQGFIRWVKSQDVRQLKRS